MITLNCDGGLCNRLRAIDAAVEFSQKAKQPLQVIWHLNKWLNCPYHLLFEDNTEFTIIQRKWYHYTGQPRHTKNPLRKFFLIGLEKIFFDKVFYEFDKLNPDIISTAPESLVKYKNIYITNSNNFLKTPRTFRYFKPIAAIQNKINALTAQLSEDTIGVHIRRTDNQWSIENSTDEAFSTKMNDAISKNSNTNFFLATDSVTTEEKFTKQYQNKIKTYQKNFERDSIVGVQDAVVDLFALASTKKIFASYYSSFSEAAAAIGNIELEIVGK